MDYQDLARLIREYGGFTRHLGTGHTPLNGYATAAGKIGISFPLEDLTPEKIGAYAQQHLGFLALKDLYLGGWVDGDTVYLDIVKVYPATTEGLEQAIHHGSVLNEKAIFNLFNKKTIWLQQESEIEQENVAGDDSPVACLKSKTGLHASEVVDSLQRFIAIYGDLPIRYDEEGNDIPVRSVAVYDAEGGYPEFPGAAFEIYIH